ncbi:hypothetical protein GGR32_002390 [Mesonia hippocampi]|uniref:4-alpha-L-fucosyltransferase (Glycosyl transferase family 56) n=1 Tax=Mesonia hippocampi TaxID=1628250 RepID=A0A840EPL4_9FLAO|nr:TDP-N-acetylfucosamine:lipid II N-acetylfucosaminyltransferase [Mesonia hippocampi]MBB4120078.1 hypothetical protein [Mesonia hippocampi]
MIIHIFTADRFHLVPTILKGFLQLQEPQFYVLARTKEDERDSVYIDIFRDFNNKSFEITHSFKELKTVSKNFKDNKIILHGVPYKWMLFFYLRGFTNVSWICWGAGTRINNKNWKSIVFTPFKRMIYTSFSKIGVLMPHDEASLRKDYGIKECVLLSYFGSLGKFPYSLENLTKEGNTSSIKKIYLGNNSSSLQTYLPLAEKLSRFKKNLYVNCMINYTFQESSISLKLREVGKAIYGDNFFMDETLYTLEDYYKYMNKCDIYICDVKGQSGLGAIFTCLRLGKKVFLSGINYDFMKLLGAVVFHVNEIDSMSKEAFFEELTYTDKVKNYKIIDNYLDKEIIIDKWKEFFKD